MNSKLKLVACLLPLATVAAFGASSGEARLADAVEHRDETAIATLMKQHADVNAAQPDGSTALVWAAHWNDLKTADLLIKAGANLNAATEYGATPL